MMVLSIVYGVYDHYLMLIMGDQTHQGYVLDMNHNMIPSQDILINITDIALLLAQKPKMHIIHMIWVVDSKAFLFVCCLLSGMDGMDYMFQQ